MANGASRSRATSGDLSASLATMTISEPGAKLDPSDSSTIYMPIVSPPTPAPSPRPISYVLEAASVDVAHASRLEFAALKSSGPTARQQYLAALLADCSPAELLFVSTTIAPLLKRDFLRDLPIELSLHILDYVDDARTLARASRVSRFWNSLMKNETTWKRMCVQAKFEDRLYPKSQSKLQGRPSSASKASMSVTNWRTKGRLLNKHRPPATTPDGGVVTSVALDHEWIVVGLASCRIQVFSARSGVLSRTLVGHESGVWAVNLVSAGGYWVDPPVAVPRPKSKQPSEDASGSSVASSTDVGARVWLSETLSKFGSNANPDTVDLGEMEFLIPDSLRIAIGLDKPRSARRSASQEPPKPSDICGASEGWGNANALVVSGGCDKQLRVWDVKSGYCIFVLEGHTSTIRCLRVLHNRPIAISGSRDTTLRVWDVQRGKLLRTLTGHDESVRCLDVCGNLAVSGSYDATCRLWNVDTGECLHVLRGHLHQIYSVAFDGKYIASGGLDTTVRVWNPVDGQCLALLQGHTALVCQLQLTGSTLATGGSDGRVIAFNLPSTPDGSWHTSSTARRIAAHDSSVTALQLDAHWLVTGGNDGRVRLYDAQTGVHVRELTMPAEAVWKVAHKYDKCVIMCKRAGKTVMEIWSYRPNEEDD
ncbi:WD40 repeat-like protein [Sanghuangporus baumii]|uniref:WD40 repeat-like protein n=1 Tax=Sanghuangporus baumii TaxID=108892 RepID=A0A9Q5HX84_SANBA|nr:WD40 repeat-like protein [Sanghuangporus baumii]